MTSPWFAAARLERIVSLQEPRPPATGAWQMLYGSVETKEKPPDEAQPAAPPQTFDSALPLQGAGAMEAEAQLVAGRGENSFSGELRGYPLEPAELVSIPAHGGQSVTYSMQMIESAQKLREAIGVSVAAAFSGFGVKASGKAAWARQQTTNDYSVYLLVAVKVSNSTLTLSRFRLNAEALALVQSPVDPMAGFFLKYGDRFVSEYITGGEFYALFEFHTHSASHRESMATSVSASGGLWKASSDFERQISQVQVNAESSLSVFINGGETLLREFRAADLVDFAREFPLAVHPVRGAPVLYETRSIDYNAAAGFPPRQLPFAANRMALEELGGALDRVRAYRCAIDYIGQHRAQFDGVPKDLAQLATPMKALEKKIELKAMSIVESAAKDATLDIDAIVAEVDGVEARLPKQVADVPLQTRSGSLALVGHGGHGPIGGTVQPRRLTQRVNFDPPFVEPPAVMVGISGIEALHRPRIRLLTENVSAQGFDLAVETWEDTFVTELSVQWLACPRH